MQATTATCASDNDVTLVKVLQDILDNHDVEVNAEQLAANLAHVATSQGHYQSLFINPAMDKLSHLLGQSMKAVLSAIPFSVRKSLHWGNLF